VGSILIARSINQANKQLTEKLEENCGET
jgi:hypothetical protein